MPTPCFPRFARAVAAFVLTTTIAHGDVFYVTDSVTDQVKRINSAGSSAFFLPAPTGLLDPQQVVLDTAGNAYVADSSLGKVLMFPAGGGDSIQVGDDVPGVVSLAFSPSGVLHVASGADDTIRKLNGSTGTFEVFVTLLPASTTIRSIAFEKSGDLYVADTAGNRIVYFDPQGVQRLRSSSVKAPFAVAFDATGKLFVTDAGDVGDNGRIVSFKGNSPNGSNTDTLISNIGDARGLAFDQANVAYCLTGAGELLRIPAKNTSNTVATNLGTVQLLTARGAGVTTIAHKGAVVPAADNSKIGTLGSPAIGNGQVAFKSVLALSAAPPVVTAANSLALFRSQPGGALELLARKSFPAPGMTVGNVSPILNLFGDPILNNTGKVAFLGTLRAGVGGVTSADALAVFSDYDGAELRPVLRRNQNNLGNGLDPAVKFTGFRQIVLPDDAGPAVIATMSGPGVTAGTNLGLWSLDLGGNLSLVLRSGAEISAGGKVRALAGLTIFNPTPLSLGQARHFGDNQTFTLAAKFTDGFAALLRVKAGGAPEVLAEKSAEVGTAIPSATFGSFGSPAMALDATLAFRTVLRPFPGVVTAATAAAIISQDPENAKVARAGDPAPDVTNGVFATLSDPVVSPSGGIAFFGRLKPVSPSVTSATSAGLWQDLGDGLHNAVRQGEAPGGIPGAARFTAFRQFVLPATGGVVFIAAIAGEGITTANNLGLWANDGAGATELLLRKGEKLSIGGKARTVTGFKVFTLAPLVTGQSRQFDATGTIACHVTCSDGTQAILAIQRP